MKRVRCPKCDYYITFDETKYRPGSSLIFQCPVCGKQFGIRMGVAQASDKGCGAIIVIENDYCYKQILPLQMGNNTIGRYMKGNNITTPIETGDLTMDLLHCVINVSRNKKGQLRFVLSDGPSNHGTFVNGERLPAREKRNLENGNVFNIGVTSIILKGEDEEAL